MAAHLIKGLAVAAKIAGQALTNKAVSSPHQKDDLAPPVSQLPQTPPPSPRANRRPTHLWKEVLNLGSNAAGLGIEALTPPVIGGGKAALHGLIKTGGHLVKGNIGKAGLALASTVAPTAAGFFGGGAAADATQGLVNSVMEHTLKTSPSTLPSSNIQDLLLKAAPGDKQPQRSNSNVVNGHKKGLSYSL